jgi:molybdopterin synthase catalytic subunit
MELYNGPLNVEEITNRWYKEVSKLNYGAFITFIGIIREENKIEALSFDIYEPILKSWFDSWQKKAKAKGAVVLMAHAIGDVKISQSSYISAVASPKRRVALELIDEFVEDFKANAPIWKYDVINGKRVYAKDRSTPMSEAGILKEAKND